VYEFYPIFSDLFVKDNSFYFRNSKIRNVSLTYLLGLEIAELKEEDMPMV